MRPAALAWRTLTAQPARMALGVLGLAAVGALLFDMLMLSRGLVVSFDELLGEMGFDVRATATPAFPGGYGPPIENAAKALERVRGLAEVESAIGATFGRARVGQGPGSLTARVVAVDPGPEAGWRLVEGVGLGGGTVAGERPPLLINRLLAQETGSAPGDRITVHADARDSIAPPLSFTVAGVVDFLFEQSGELTVAMTREEYQAVTGDRSRDEMDLLLVRSRRGARPSATAEAVRKTLPGMHVFTNDQFLARFDRDNFSYFKQISFVLSTVTLFFAFLLVATLLTVTVNQRLAEIAALRALGFSRRRVMWDLCWESGLLVGCGSLLSLPLGLVIARWLDVILKGMPGIPLRIHFFVFEFRSLVLYLALMGVAASLALLYPIWLTARLPIAATLRRETVG